MIRLSDRTRISTTCAGARLGDLLLLSLSLHRSCWIDLFEAFLIAVCALEITRRATKVAYDASWSLSVPSIAAPLMLVSMETVWVLVVCRPPLLLLTLRATRLRRVTLMMLVSLASGTRCCEMSQPSAGETTPAQSVSTNTTKTSFRLWCLLSLFPLYFVNSFREVAGLIQGFSEGGR